MTQSIRYIASIDTSSANPDGSIADYNALILDTPHALRATNLLD